MFERLPLRVIRFKQAMRVGIGKTRSSRRIIEFKFTGGGTWTQIMFHLCRCSFRLKTTISFTCRSVDTLEGESKFRTDRITAHNTLRQCSIIHAFHFSHSIAEGNIVVTVYSRYYVLIIPNSDDLHTGQNSNKHVDIRN